MVRSGKARFDWAWQSGLGMALFGWARLGMAVMVWDGRVSFGLVWFGSLWFNLLQFASIWFKLVLEGLNAFIRRLPE